MPKVSEKIYRRHASAPSSNKLAPQTDKLENVSITREQRLEPSKSNIFKRVFIPPEVLKQNLSSSDKESVEICFNRKSERYWRRKKLAFHEVVESAKEFLKRREAAKKKAKKDILGNFQSLTDALPDLKELMEKKAKEDVKPRAAKCFSKQDAEMMEDLLTYQHVLNNPEYIADPLGTVTDQLRQRLQSGSL